MNANQMVMLRQIMELEFVAIELNLFLDTHPDDREALRDFQEVTSRLNALIADYERQYTPLFPTSPYNADKCWRWIESPWPWEI